MNLDFETYSQAGYVWDEANGKWHGPRGAPKGGKGLGVVGAAVYAEHPSTEVLTLSYNLGDNMRVRRWQPGQPPPIALHAHVARGGLLHGWNTAFEWWIWNLVCTRKYGWPPLPLFQTRCTMAQARAAGLPGKLELAAEVVGIPEAQKDKRGAGLLKLFSMPRTPTKADPRLRIQPADAPADAMALYEYCDQDTRAEAAIAAVTPALEGEELDFWLADQLINRRGVHVDRPSLMACVAIVEQCLETFDAELCALTGGVAERTSQLERLKGWLAGHGVHLASMDEDAIASQLSTMPPHPPGGQSPARRALELRRLAGSASVKKVFAMANQLSSRDRLHDLFNYHAARTGRPTGEGPQPTNLPKAGPAVRLCACGRYHGAHADACPWCGAPVPAGAERAEWSAEAVEDALEVIRTRSVALVQLFFGDALLTVSGCLRGLFCAAPGHELIASDYSAIEAVVAAALAGEQWRLDVFAGDTSIYLESASRAFGVPVADMLEYHKANGMHHPLRDKGKRMELGLGFGGWVGALRSPQINYEGTDDELKDAILKWRAASPAIVYMWGGQEKRDGWTRTPCMYGLEGTAILAMQAAGPWHDVARLNGTLSGLAFQFDGSHLRMRLPSGRALTYRNAQLERSMRDFGGEWSVSFEGYNSNPKAGAIGWQRMYQYGGRWMENACQAVARDIQRSAILNLERAGYPVVLHVYDEDVAEVPIGQGSVEGLEAQMMRLPAWAAGWPIKAAGGWRGRRYRKA